MKIQPSELSHCVMTELHRLGDAYDAVLEHAAKTAAAHAVIELKLNSPTLTGAYAHDWSYKVDKRAKFGGVHSVVVYNRKNYGLIHLLEDGHTKVVFGNRIGGTVSARVHVAPVVRATIQEYEKLVMEGIRRESG